MMALMKQLKCASPPFAQLRLLLERVNKRERLGREHFAVQRQIWEAYMEDPASGLAALRAAKPLAAGPPPAVPRVAVPLGGDAIPQQVCIPRLMRPPTK